MKEKPLDQTVIDFQDKILHLFDNPAECAEHLAQQISELIGARLVLIAINTEEPSPDILSVFPTKSKDWCHQQHILQLIELSFTLEKTHCWKKEAVDENLLQLLNALDADKVIAIPLINRNKLVGSILMIDFLELYDLDSVLKLLDKMSGVFKLIIRNFLLYSNLENIIEIKTNQLQKRNEELLESEAKFKNFFENSIVGKSITSLDGKLNVNNAFCEILGYTRNELSNRLWQSITHEDDLEDNVELLNSMLRGERGSARWIKRYIHKTGKVVWVDVSVSLQRDKEGNPECFYTTIIDITERKQAEMAQKESESKFAAVFNASPVGFLIYDSNKKIVEVNQAYSNLTGYSKEELIGNRSIDIGLINEEEKLKILEEVKLSGGVLDNYEVELSKRDGTKFQVLFSSREIFINGQSHRLGTNVDITDLKKVEETLRKSERRYRTVLETAMDGFWLVDMDQHLLEVNESYIRMSGYSRQELIGMNITEFRDPATTSEVPHLVDKVLKQGEDRYEIRHIRKDGTSFDVEVSVQYQPTEGGQFVVFLRDITGQKQAKMKLLEALDEAEQFRKALDHISSYVFIKNTELNYTYANQKALVEFRCAGKSLNEISKSGFFPLEALNKLKETDSRVLQGESISEEIDIINSAGKSVTYLVSKDPIYDFKTNNIKGLLGIATDVTERKRIENVLRESESKLLKAMDIAKLCFWEYDYTTDEFTFNDQFYKLYHTTAEQEGGYKMSSSTYAQKFIPQNERSVVADGLRRSSELFDSDHHSIEEHPIICRDGEIRYITVSSFIIKDDQGRAVKLKGQNQDITERKQIENELRESNSQLRLILDNIPIAIWDWNLQTDKVFATPKYYAMLGLEPQGDSFYPPAWRNLTHPDDLEMVKLKIDSVQNEGVDNYAYDTRMLHASGTYRWYSVFANVIDRNPEGKATRLMGVRIDIDERKRAEKTLQAREMQLSSMYQTVEDMIFLLEIEDNNQYRFVSVNQAFCKVTGLTEEMVVGKLLNEVFSESSLSIVLEKYNQAIRENSIIRWEETFIYPTGETIGDVSVAPVVVENGHGRYLVGAIHDITERKKSEEKIAKLNRVNLVLGNVNHAVVHVKEKQELLDKVCKIAIEDGKFRMAWIGIVNAKTNKVDPVASYGEVDGYLDKINIDLNDPVRGQGPSGRSIKTGMHCFSNNIATDKIMAPWRNEALLRGYKSSISLPFEVVDGFKGAITIYSNEVDFFTEEEIELLDKLAMDISYALEFIENEVKRKTAEEKIAKLNRVNLVLSNVNHAVVHVKEKQDLFSKVCQIAIEDGKFRMAWIGIVNAKTNEVDPVASCGKVDGYLDDINIDLNNPVSSNGPTGRAIKTGKYSYSNNIETDENLLLWRESTLKRGYRSMIALPFEVIGSFKGALTIFSSEEEFFNEEEIELLDKLAMDVSFALEFLENESERKKAEDNLRESEEKLATLFASMTEMLVLHELVFDEHGKPINSRIIDCNDAFTQVTGIKKENAIGRIASEVFGVEGTPYFDIYSKVAMTGKSYSFNMYYEPLDKYFMTSVVSPRKNRFATITRDITEIQQKQEELNSKNKELENFIYVTSHDLRSPLVNIQGFSQRMINQTVELGNFIRDCEFNDEKKSNIEKIMRDDIPKSLSFITSNVYKMDVLIKGLLQISRTGRMALVVQQIDMNQLMKTIVANYSFQLTEIKADISIKNLTDCYGDENLLNQLFSNLIGNAIKYRDPNRKLVIEISSHKHFNKVIYNVKDTGIGISSKNLEKIWNVFYRVNTSTPEPGDGLGLSLAKTIAEKNKGKIWAESEEGKGSTFYVELQRNKFTE